MAKAQQTELHPTRTIFLRTSFEDIQGAPIIPEYIVQFMQWWVEENTFTLYNLKLPTSYTKI